MHRKLKGQGLLVIVINRGDDVDTIAEFIQKGKFTFPVVMNGKGDADMAEKYDVRTFPSNYLLDSDGKVMAISSKCSDQRIQKGLRKVGFVLPHAR